jgi:hypothetical protein
VYREDVPKGAVMNLIDTINFNQQSPISHPDSEDTTVAIDFDGVLCRSDGPYEFGHFGPPIPEGLKLIKRCKDEGYNVVIFTARKETDLVSNWLRQQGFAHMFVTNHKIPCSAYVDDRAIPWNQDTSLADEVVKYVKNPAATLKLKV